MSRKINTSFKGNDEEMKLYSEVIAHSSQSGFIKDALKFYLKYRRYEGHLKRISKENDVAS